MKDRFVYRAAGIVLALLILAGRPGLSQAGRAAEGFVLGPVQETRLVEDFTAARAKAWRPRSGSNVAYTVRGGMELPGVATSLMALDIRRKDLGDGDASHNWFALSRDGLPAGTLPEDMDGLRFLLGSRREVQWWISVDLVTGEGETFSHVLADHTFPAGRIVEYTVPLEAFRSKAGTPLTPEKARAVRGIAFAFSSPGTTLYLDRIAAYRREKLRSWLDFTTSHPGTNLFQRTDPVSLTFTMGGRPPERAAGFRYEVRDYWNRVTARGAVRLTGARTYTFPATPKTHGYYEVRAFWTDAAGKDLPGRSCLRAEGTVPEGLGTFSVLPGTIAENHTRFRRLGAKAFFGLHGDFLGLADYAGLAWRFDYSAWRYLEPQKPDRSAGMSPWVRERMRQAPMPDYRLHIQPFLFNLGGSIPDWAKSGNAAAPAFARWEDAMALVRDHARVEQHLYPHMKPRLYGGAWEVNLNMPPYSSQPPPHSPEDITELFRRVREAVKTEDPDGMVLGPCPSVIDPAWFEPVLKAGVLRYLDGIETHGYLEGVFTPEENDFPGKIARLNALVRRYNGGRALPIYCTEAGQPGILGAEIVYRSQAQRMARTAIILKGEGVRVFLSFYGIDYDRAGYWGYCFNKDVDAPEGPWATKRVSPKPMVNAMAVCAEVLEGARPRGRLRLPDRDAWAYVFARDGATITAAWTPGKARTVRLPMGRARSVRAVDIMGHSRPLPIAGGAVRLSIDGSPVYVVAVSPKAPKAAARR